MKSSEICRALAAALMIFVIIDAVSAECQFGETLTVRSRWETQMTKERRSTGAFYRFSGSRMEVREFTKTDSKKVDIWQCQRELAENTYILKMDYAGPGGNERFMCVQFIVRGKKVIQRKHSSVQGTGAASLCDDLELDPWPLVWPEMDDDYSVCPLDGGFSLDVREYMHQESLCLDDGNQILKPHLESECIKGEGIRIEFRHFECKGNLGMEIVQNLACLASWEDGEYRFTIVTDQDELWPKLWMMRLPRVNLPLRPVHAVLSQDIVADTSEYFGSNQEVPSDRLYELILSSDNYPHLCDNEAEVCDGMCSSGNEVLCKKDCGLCQPSDTITKCDFDFETRGQWEEKDKTHGTQTVTITKSMLYAGDLIPFKCYQLYADGWFEGTGRKALVTLFKNGCKPRYTCAELQMKSPHVMAYRLSQSSVLPTKANVNAGDVCSEIQFADDPEPLGRKYRSKEAKILVRKGTKREPVPCNIPSTYMLDGFSQDGKKLAGMLWNAALGYESSSDTVLHETCGSSEHSSFHKSRSMKCIASYKPDNTTQFIIMEEKDNPDVVECWALYAYEWESTERMMILPPSHCNQHTPFRVDFGDNMNFIAKYLLSELRWGSDPCAEFINSSLPESTTGSMFDSGSVPPGNDNKVADAMVDISKEDPAPASWSIKVRGLKSHAKTLRPLQGLMTTILVVTYLLYN